MKRNNLLMHILLVVALLITALSLAGCSGSGSTAGTSAVTTTATSTETTTASTANAGSQAVSIKSNAFDPASLTIKVGDTITWANNDSYAHTVTSDNGAFDSGSMAGGATFSFTFKTAGTFSYHCGIHTFMTAKIIVQ
ncbi:MAG: cupredoxin family copper-binding protein [Actinobacteria bacterium]|nr:cupredoxin family copper-binding protein [Actinomycetota bacterium]